MEKVWAPTISQREIYVTPSTPFKLQSNDRFRRPLVASFMGKSQMSTGRVFTARRHPV